MSRPKSGDSWILFDDGGEPTYVATVDLAFVHLRAMAREHPLASPDAPFSQRHKSISPDLKWSVVLTLEVWRDDIPRWHASVALIAESLDRVLPFTEWTADDREAARRLLDSLTSTLEHDGRFKVEVEACEVSVQAFVKGARC